MEVHNWWVKEGATGAQDTLVIPQFTAGYDIWLLYIARHPAVYLAATTINEVIDLKALAVHAAVECLFGQMNKGSGNKSLPGMLNRLMAAAETMPLVRSVVPKPNKFRIISDGRASSYTGEVGKVRL